MSAFLDSSALIKYFAHEAGSRVVIRLIDHGEPLWVSELAFLECVSAIAKKIREGEMAGQDFIPLYRALVLFFASNRCNIVPVNDATMIQAVHLLSIWGLYYSLTSLEALQLASALEARELAGSDIEFYCSDRNLIAAANRAVVGLIPIDPEAV